MTIGRKTAGLEPIALLSYYSSALIQTVVCNATAIATYRVAFEF